MVSPKTNDLGVGTVDSRGRRTPYNFLHRVLDPVKFQAHQNNLTSTIYAYVQQSVIEVVVVSPRVNTISRVTYR